MACARDRVCRPYDLTAGAISGQARGPAPLANDPPVTDVGVYQL